MRSHSQSNLGRKWASADEQEGTIFNGDPLPRAQLICVSGKSTLLSTILRLADLTAGTIQIDSVDLSTLDRTSLRQHLTTIPQTPLHIPGTLRQNLDPFSTLPDQCLTSALKKVRLWTTLKARGGLGADLHPEELSQGQQQLLALARAILNKRKVVLLDEATSSVDIETERIMRDVLSRDFKECTVLTVAHRRETILDSDIVVVLEAGRVVESGEPGMLMGRQEEN